MADSLVCKCCGKPARWCDEQCGAIGCDRIICDHCGMLYSLESEAAQKAETTDEAKRLMLEAYKP